MNSIKESKKENEKDNHMEQYNKKTYLNLNPELFKPSINTSSTNRIDKKLENNLLLILENLITDEQSKNLIEAIEDLNFQKIDWEYPPDYRSCRRKIVFSEDLALFQWKRIVNYFEWEDLQFISPFGFEKESRWLAHKVNPCFMFTKYQKGDFFKMHLDGGHVQIEDDRSVLSLMIYLNDDFKGGNTVFYENGEEFVIKPKKMLRLFSIMIFSMKGRNWRNAINIF